MELLLYARPTNTNHLGYATNDIVISNPDGFAWGSGELDASVFTVVTVPNSAKNLAYADYPDDTFINKVGSMGVGVFRHKNFSHENLTPTKNRKYTFNPVTQKIEGKV